MLYATLTSASVSVSDDEQPLQPPMWYAAKTQRALGCCASASFTFVSGENAITMHFIECAP